MKTYNLDLRHAPCKRRLNAMPGNRLEPLKARLVDDVAAVAWARGELMEFASRRRGQAFQYVEVAVVELLPFGAIIDGKDFRRLGRWVCNADGIIWRDSETALENV